MNSVKRLSHTDHQRLRRQSFDLWSQNDLANFLVLDYFIAPLNDSWTGQIQKEYLKQLETSALRYDKFKFILKIIDWIYFRLYKIKYSKKKSILFQNSRYDSIILGAKKYYHVGIIAEGKQDRLFAVKNFLGYFSTNDLEGYVLLYLKDKDIKWLYIFLEKIEKKLKLTSHNYIILRDDCSPVSRAIILAARKLGIMTIVIQHGLYDSFSTLYNCLAADRVLVWGKYFKSFIEEKTLRSIHEVYVLGYPHAITNENFQKTNTVCYLGQNLEKYDKKFLAVKLNSVKEILRICKGLNLKLIYRPHPRDDREFLKEKLADIEFVPQGESLYKTIKKTDIFIGFSSTSLIEAAMFSRISLQLANYPIKVDNFENFGACGKTFKNVIELENYLKNLSEEKFQFNNNYIETRFNPGKLFLEILKCIN